MVSHHDRGRPIDKQCYWELLHRVSVCRCRRFYAADADKVSDGSHNLLTGSAHPGFTSPTVTGYNLTVALAAVAWHPLTISIAYSVRTVEFRTSGPLDKRPAFSAGQGE